MPGRASARRGGCFFRGDVDGYHDGELFFPHSPILTVESTFGEALVLETVLLSVLTVVALVASPSVRWFLIAQERKRLGQD